MQKFTQASIIAGIGNCEIEVRMRTSADGAQGRRFCGRKVQRLATNRTSDDVGGLEGIHASVAYGNLCKMSQRLEADSAIGRNKNGSNVVECHGQTTAHRREPRAA